MLSFGSFHPNLPFRGWFVKMVFNPQKFSFLQRLPFFLHGRALVTGTVTPPCLHLGFILVCCLLLALSTFFNTASSFSFALVLVHRSFI